MIEDPHEFEDEVRRIARFRWPSAENSGGEMIDGRERDGIFETDDCIHLLECTTSRAKAKALDDLKKLYSLFTKYQRSHTSKAIKCWFITRDEPTADQQSCKGVISGAPTGLFNVVSFATFRSKLIDSIEYLQLRSDHKFGSVYDPRNDSTQSPLPYIDVTIRSSGNTGTTFSINDLADTLDLGGRIALLGEYGIGKSMTLRQIFRTLATRHRSGKTDRFPIYINLREHQAQHEPAEILERHARNIGFQHPSQLVRAWKAGYAILLLDGFDEVSSLGLQGAWRKLRDARFASTAGLRRLVHESPTSCGIAIAGRENFFDTTDERKKALGQNGIWLDIRLDEFTEEQIKKLVEQFGYKGNIPPWLPCRPLLLSTLFAKGISDQATDSLNVLSDPATGWDMLLTEVCNREAKMEIGVSGENIRSILESLATLARTKETGLGPVFPQDIISLFEKECGYHPTDEALIVLQRLPGLGRDTTGGEESRCFVDKEFADACRAGDLVSYLKDPFGSETRDALSKTIICTGQTGIGIASLHLMKDNFNSGRMTASIKALLKLTSPGAIAADILQLALAMNLPLQHTMQISNLLFDRMELTANRPDITNVEFADCYFGILDIPVDISADSCPSFSRCLIQEVESRVSQADLPQNRFNDCVIESFMAPTGGTSGALDLHVAIGAQVLVSTLKKLFVQSLSGRKENALYRGMDSAHQSRVTPVLDLLKRHNLAEPTGKGGEPIWIPVRWQKSRVMAMLEAPSVSQDPVMQAARKL